MAKALMSMGTASAVGKIIIAAGLGRVALTVPRDSTLNLVNL
jgi:cobyric acid synthase